MANVESIWQIASGDMGHETEGKIKLLTCVEEAHEHLKAYRYHKIKMVKKQIAMTNHAWH